MNYFKRKTSPLESYALCRWSGKKAIYKTRDLEFEFYGLLVPGMEIGTNDVGLYSRFCSPGSHTGTKGILTGLVRWPQ